MSAASRRPKPLYRPKGETPQLKAVAREFPKLRVTGGPSAHNLEVTVDGEPVQKVFELDIHAGVNTAVSASIHQFAEVDIEVDAVVEQGVIVRVREPVRENDVIVRWDEVAVGKGATLAKALWEAAKDADVRGH